MRQAFHDATGREWRVRLNLGLVTAVREFVGVRLLDPTELDNLGKCDQFTSVVWMLLDERDVVGRSKFIERLTPEYQDAAKTAVLESVVSFLNPAVATDSPAEPEKPATAQPPRDLELFCYELAGAAAVDGRPLTLRQLTAMAAGRFDAEAVAVHHGQAARIDALVRNPYRRAKPVTAADAERESKEAFDEAGAMLRAMTVEGA